MRRATKDRSNVRDLVEPSLPHSLIPRAWRRRVQRTSSLIESFYHALRGISVAFGSERNLKIHSALTVIAITLASYLKFDSVSWALLFLAIGMVITAELLNTALERSIDMFTGGEFNNLAKDAKDIAAGAVFCASLASVGMGIALYLPKLIAIIH